MKTNNNLWQKQQQRTTTNYRYRGSRQQNKNNNIICNLWLLLFSTLISQGRLIQIEGWGPVSTNLGPVSSNWDRGRKGSEIRDPGQGAENTNTRDIVLIRSCGTDFEFSAAIFWVILMWSVYCHHGMLAYIDRRENCKRLMVHGFHSWEMN